jgi:tetrahydromethanopterin S-methyltransferase subunit F
MSGRGGLTVAAVRGLVAGLVAALVIALLQR